MPRNRNSRLPDEAYAEILTLEFSFIDVLIRIINKKKPRRSKRQYLSQAPENNRLVHLPILVEFIINHIHTSGYKDS